MNKKSLNRVILIGRIGLTPEKSFTQSGLSISTFSLATNEILKNAEGTKIEHTEWHNIVSIGKQSNFVSEFLKKGQLVSIEGRLRTKKWKDKNKINHYKTEVITDSITPLEWKDDAVNSSTSIDNTTFEK